MAIIAHMTMLQEKHSKLEGMITEEAHRPMPDFDVIQTLKKQKLLIKEEIARLQMLTEQRIDAA